MRDLIKNIVEKMYYKCFPDRVRDHEIANMPVTPHIIEERGNIVNLKTIIEIKDYDPFNPPDEFIKKEIKRKLGEMIEPEIRVERDALLRLTRYSGYIKIVRRRDYDGSGY